MNHGTGKDLSEAVVEGEQAEVCERDGKQTPAAKPNSISQIDPVSSRFVSAGVWPDWRKRGALTLISGGEGPRPVLSILQAPVQVWSRSD